MTRITRAHYAGPFVPEPPPASSACMRGDGLGGGSVYLADVVASGDRLRRQTDDLADLMAGLTARLALMVTCAWCGNPTPYAFDAHGPQPCIECDSIDPLGMTDRACEECDGSGVRHVHRGDGQFPRTVQCWAVGCEDGRVEAPHVAETEADLRRLGIGR